MGMKKELKNFASAYEETVQELLVLTSESVGGAGSIGNGVWRPSAEFLASVALADGELKEEKGSLHWLAGDEDRNGWIYHLKPLTIYHVKCRAKKQPKSDGSASGESNRAHMNFYMLVDVVERDLHHPELERVLADYQRIVEFTDDLCGHFTLERRFDWFSAEVDWLGSKCNVLLECDEENGETAGQALAYFKQIYGNLQEWDKGFRDFAAEKLTELANDWLADMEEDEEDGEENEITEESFAKRIGISELTMEPDGSYEAYYEDDDMFYGHVIIINGNVDTGMEDAYIAG